MNYKDISYKTITATAIITILLGLIASGFTSDREKLNESAPKDYVDEKSAECHEYIDMRFLEHEKSEKILNDAVQNQLSTMQGDLTIIKNHILRND